jgi:hypothetical protein
MRQENLLGFVLFLLLISVACGGRAGTGTRSGSSGGSGNGVQVDVPAGQLTVIPSALNFGQVAVGQSEKKTGTLKAGNASITISSADWKGEGYSISGITFPATVAAGQSISFDVTFTPQKSGSSTGTISFISDAANSPHAESLKASGSDNVASHSVTLSWRADGAKTVGYNIYRATESKGPFARINSKPHPAANFTDASVQGGQTYFYVTTALNEHGKESKYSNRVQVTIPNS